MNARSWMKTLTCGGISSTSTWLSTASQERLAHVGERASGARPSSCHRDTGGFDV